MHELSIAAALIDQLLELAEREGGGRVTELRVRLGAFSGVEQEALAFAFPIAAEGTPVEGAALFIDQEPPRAVCSACGEQAEADPRVAVCLRCGSADLRLNGSREMLLMSVSLTEPAHAATSD